ncbi:FtsW/RodA/SpoVE family cell cycle protein [Pseudoduganella sp. RAF19]|uniref:FtsW/RodA/SpoVE family cell cycle protein n=1 Tax=Pseudoduganella sp. RAF19 TaxID=3233052 RepID=UPI003F9A64BD
MSRARSFLLAALAALCALQVFALLRTPSAWLPQEIAIHLSPGESIVLGRRELAAPQADNAHIELSRTSHGDWQLRSLSTGRAPLLQSDDHDESLATVPVASLPAFRIGTATFALTASDSQQAEFLLGDQRWHYDGATLYRNGAAQSSCPDAHWTSRAVALWNRTVPRALTIARPLQFGGNLYCGNRLGIPGLAPDSAAMSRANGQLRLTDTARAPRPLDGVQTIALGQTRFTVHIARDALLLTPTRRVALFATADARLPPQVSWTWQQHNLWHACSTIASTSALTASAIATLALAALALAAFAIRVPRFARPRTVHNDRHRTAAARIATVIAAVALFAAGLSALIAQRTGHPPAIAASLLIAMLSLSLWIAIPSRLTLATSCALLLLAAGLLAQLELGLGAPDTSWLRYYQKTTALLAIGSAAAALWRQLPARAISQRAIEYLLLCYATIALIALAAQVLWGDETGVFDLQPVELAKLALTALTAHCLALRLGWREQSDNRTLAARWLRLIAPAMLFFALLAFALVQVDDYSPLVLLMLWTGVTALAYGLAARNWRLSAALAAVAIAGIAAVVMLRDGGTEGLARLPSAFYADRFQVWLDPAHHPHTGQQLLQGASAIAEGGLAGTDSMFGLRALGQHVGSVTAIPEVQDDFAPSFFLNRHGLLSALLLWCLQAGFLAGLLLIAVRAARSASAARNFRHAWSARFRCFALCGGAAFVFGHFLLSWGTNLSIFPVMGQPMSFLSAGGSHLLFFLLPLLAFSAVSAQSLEE